MITGRLRLITCLAIENDGNVDVSVTIIKDVHTPEAALLGGLTVNMA
jgi:hypothetical protein